MSSICFHSAAGEVRVSGRERAMMSGLCSDFLMLQMGDFRSDDLEWVKYVTNPAHYLHAEAARQTRGDFADRQRFIMSLETSLRVGDVGLGSAFWLGGEPVDLFCLALNSALQWGNRAVQLCAKLHGQCEIHCYVEGCDRAWLADLVDEAVAADVLRPDPWGYDGWAKLAEFLRANNAEPVVTSYSVTDSFPNPAFVPDDLKLDPDDPWEAWSQIEESKQWEYGMAKLRAEPGLRLSPDRLGNPFGDGMTGREFMRRATALVPPPASKAA